MASPLLRSQPRAPGAAVQALGGPGHGALASAATQAIAGGLFAALPDKAWASPAPQVAQAWPVPEGLLGLWQVEGLLPLEACAALVAALEALAFRPTAWAYPSGYRNNDRLVVDDAALAAALWPRVAPWLPAEIEVAGQRWRAVGLNPRFRACRYAEGQAFAPHRDGAYQPAAGRRSWLTLQLYLDEGFAGGRTPFLASQGGPELLAVAPRVGRAIAFDHRLWHAGEAVAQGVKHVLRTDVLFEAIGGAEGGDGLGHGHGEGAWRAHQGYLWALAADGDRLWSAGRDGRLVAWAPEGEGLRQAGAWALGRGSLSALAAGPAGLALGARSGAVGLWDRQGQAGWWGEAGAAILALAWGPGGRLWASTAAGELLAWEAQGALVRRVVAHQGWAWALACDGAGRLWSAGEDGRLCAWGAGGQLQGAWRFPAPLLALAPRPDGGLLLGDAEGRLWAWSPAEGPRLLRQDHQGPLLALAAGPGGAWASGGEDGWLRWGQGDALVGGQPSGDFVRAVRPWRQAWWWGGHEGLIRQRDLEGLALA